MGKFDEDNEKATQAYAAIGVGFVCLIVGVPLWWKTTDVYRVQLPYSDISSLAENKLKYLVQLEVICFDDKVSSSSLNTISKLLHNLNTVGDDVDSKYHVTVRQAIGDEKTTFKAAKHLQELDESISGLLRDDMNQIHILLVPKSKRFALPNVYVGTHRNVILQITDETTMATVISTTLKDVVVRGNQMEKRLIPIRGLRTLKPDKESMRVAKCNPGYDVTFTLVNPQPDLLDVRWDIRAGVEAYLKPFVDKLQRYAQLDINSQVLFYPGLVRPPQHDKGSNSYYYMPSDLPHIINPLETKLGSHVSTNPSLEFIVYIPYRDQSPLYIRNQQGEQAMSNAFLSPQWGGIYIYNVPDLKPGTELPAPVEVDMRQVMEVFLAQLRLLLGVQTQNSVSVSDVTIVPPIDTGIAQWEVDSWLRGRCLENLATSTATLTSLAQLLGQISNIVIRDEIGQEVQLSVDSIRQSQKFLSEGELEKAFIFSKQAIVSSEKAFFDPSLLELLYFPEDQKFAIYIPLFLPISIPVVMSILQAIKWYRHRNDSKLDKDKED